MKLFRVLDIVSFVGIRRLDCIGRVSRMNTKKISQVFRDIVDIAGGKEAEGV